MTPNDSASAAVTDESDQTAGVAAYAAAVASRQPTPGGGSVVGVAAALAAALGAMVCRFTPPLNSVSGSSGPDTSLVELDRLRGELLALANADAAAYAAYRMAAALPKETDADRGRRREAMQAALITATEIPLTIARGALRLHVLLARVAAAGNPHLRSDAEIGSLLAAAALRGSLINVRGNVDLLKDASTADRFRAEADELERRLTG